MDAVLKYRSREVSAKDVEFIAELIAANPQASVNRAQELIHLVACRWASDVGVGLRDCDYRSDRECV